MPRRSGKRMMRRKPGAKPEEFDAKKLEKYQQEAAKAAETKTDKPADKPAEQ